ncbi:MAG: zf-HC2 domain-containing protein [Proteobacteria bacterium]|nr:zf-HC2 domain-containing protein [Pseudomonadota bacterium]
MRHWRARRLLASLLDGTLPPRRAAAVRTHAAQCRECAAALADFERADALLRELPASLMPLEPSPAARHRLLSLARWGANGQIEYAPRSPVPALGFASAILVFFLSVTAGTWVPVVPAAAPPIVVASAIPEAAYAPMGLRSAQH